MNMNFSQGELIVKLIREITSEILHNFQYELSFSCITQYISKEWKPLLQYDSHCVCSQDKLVVVVQSLSRVQFLATLWTASTAL